MTLETPLLLSGAPGIPRLRELALRSVLRTRGAPPVSRAQHRARAA